MVKSISLLIYTNLLIDRRKILQKSRCKKVLYKEKYLAENIILVFSK